MAENPHLDPRGAGSGQRRFRVLTISSNKGGVGKTTLACNLAVYLRALREDLPVLLMTFDDQPMSDRMFAFSEDRPSETVATGFHAGSFEKAIRLGQYGVHYVPFSPQVAQLKSEIASQSALCRVLERTDWNGLVIIDTKSDLEVLTQNAIAASDLTTVLVSDHASLDEARKIFALLDEWKRPHRRARVLLSLVDLRVKFREGDERDILALLLGDIRRRGYPLFESFVSRSPAIEMLYTNPDERAYAIMHRARTSLVHRQMHHIATEVLAAFEEVAPLPDVAEPESVYRPPVVAREPLPSPRPAARVRPDRRQQVRRSYGAEAAAFRGGEPRILPLRTLDLSLDGMGIEPARELARGERAHVALPQPRGDSPLLLWARVVREDEAGARGLAFESADPPHRNRLEELTEKLRLAASA